MPRYAGPLVLIIIVLVLTGCTPALDDSGSLTLEVGDAGVRGLGPDIRRMADHFRVSGAGPGGTRLSMRSNSSSIAVPSLVGGEWEFTVDVVDNSGRSFARGSLRTAVGRGRRPRLQVPVLPVPGTGELKISLEWPLQSVEHPRVEAYLVSLWGEVITLSFEVGDGRAVLEGSTLPTGYHTLVMKLYDGEMLVQGFVELVKLWKGLLTEALYRLDELCCRQGSLDVRIVPDMAEPLDVDIASDATAIPYASSATFEASAHGDPGEVVYVWYRNGVSVHQGPRLATAANLAPGYYRLDVLAFTADGRRAGSETRELQIMPASGIRVSSGEGFAPLAHTAWLAKARLGDNTATGAYEVELGRGPGERAEANRSWAQGETAPFAVTYDPDEGTAMFRVGDTVVSQRVPWNRAWGHIGITAKMRGEYDGVVTVDALSLNGDPLLVDRPLSATSAYTHVLVSNAPLGNGFTLEGTLRFSWNRTANEIPAVQISVGY